MTLEALYSIANWVVIPAWLLLVILPKSDITKKLVHSGLYPLVYGVFYVVLFIRAIFFGQSAEDGGFASLETVMIAFSHPNVTLMGWAHYLVFDLFVGAWIGRDALARGVNHLLVIPCLFFSWFAGPVGLLLYLLLSHATGKGSVASLTQSESTG